MKKKKVKSLKLNKRSISNINEMKAGVGPTGYSPCQYTPTAICDYFTNEHGMCKKDTKYSQCIIC